MRSLLPILLLIPGLIIFALAVPTRSGFSRKRFILLKGFFLAALGVSLGLPVYAIWTSLGIGVHNHTASRYARITNPEPDSTAYVHPTSALSENAGNGFGLSRKELSELNHNVALEYELAVQDAHKLDNERAILYLGLLGTAMTLFFTSLVAFMISRGSRAPATAP